MVELSISKDILVTLPRVLFDGKIIIVDNHIKKLRKALGAAGPQIKTVISKGYKLTE